MAQYLDAVTQSFNVALQSFDVMVHNCYAAAQSLDVMLHNCNKTAKNSPITVSFPTRPPISPKTASFRENCVAGRLPVPGGSESASATVRITSHAGVRLLPAFRPVRRSTTGRSRKPRRSRVLCPVFPCPSRPVRCALQLTQIRPAAAAVDHVITRVREFESELGAGGHHRRRARQVRFVKSQLPVAQIKFPRRYARGRSPLAGDFTSFRYGLSPASRLLHPAKTPRAI